jgi:hypothetical protein
MCRARDRALSRSPRASDEHHKSDSHATLCWREMDSNFSYGDTRAPKAEASRASRVARAPERAMLAAGCDAPPVHQLFCVRTNFASRLVRWRSSRNQICLRTALGNSGRSSPTENDLLAGKGLVELESLTSLLNEAGLTNIEAREVKIGYLLRNQEEWWDICWNSGFRGPLAQLNAADLRQFREGHLREVGARNPG